VRASRPLAALLALAALAAAAATAAQAGRAVTKICIVSASGALGGNKGGTAGGLPQPGGAKASLSVICNFLSSSVQIRVPSHTIAMKTFVHGLPGKCTQSGDTVSCKLDVPLLKVGLDNGGWQDTFAWKFTPGDSTSHNTVDGSCHVPMVVTLTNGKSVAYTKKTQTVCEYALGDALR
jgi:hypothetical protein